jgi:arylsulfatase A-like enzyme
VIIVGDHGDEFREHSRYGHKNLPYDELIHVPLIFRFPDRFSFESGTVVNEWVRCLDILPTVLDILPGSLSNSMREHIEGESIIPTIESLNAPSFSHVIIEKDMLEEDSLRIAFRTKGWKYIFDEQEDHEYLYDLTEDPDESRDVSAEYEGVLQDFQDRLDDRLDSIERTSQNISIPDIEEADGVNERLRALGYKE